MPSIQDVADQINAKLDQINQNTVDTVTVCNGIRSDLAQANSKLDAIDTDIIAGVAEISAGLFAIWELEKVTNSILEHHSKQTDTVICLLENANELLCGMTRKLTRQLELSERHLDSTRRIEGMSERVHADAAGSFDRHAKLQAEILACCPPDEPELEPCPEPCTEPKERPYKPKGQDWKPSPSPQPIG